MNFSSCWPNRQQQYLLQACLAQSPQEGQKLLSLWETTLSFESLDHGSGRLIPYLSKKIIDFKLETPYLDKYKGAWKHCFANNVQYTSEAIQISKVLDQKNIQCLALKGLPLVHYYYRDIALRPMDDIDLLVQPQDLETCIKTLKENGYLPTFQPLKRILPLKHSTPFSKHHRQELDLHWRPLREWPKDFQDHDIWKRSSQLFPHAPLKKPSDEDCLLQVIAHGLRWNPVPSFRWILDAHQIIEQSLNRFDLDYFVQQAYRYRLCDVVKIALQKLKQSYDTPIPMSWLNALDQRKRSWGKLEHWVRINPWGGICLHYLQYQRQDPQHRQTNFSDYLAQLWGLPNQKQLPKAILKRVKQRLGRGL